ncbi:hypothetical protein PO909_000592 [Leuciscus waleckii]
MAPVAAADAAPSTSFIMGPADLLPRRSLATALPASTTGAPFFPPAAAISSQLHAQILAVCRIQAVSRSDEGPAPGHDDNAVLK